MLSTIEQKIFCVNTNYKTNNVQIIYDRKFNFNTFPRRGQFFKLDNCFKSHLLVRIIEQRVPHYLGLR